MISKMLNDGDTSDNYDNITITMEERVVLDPSFLFQEDDKVANNNL
jgi:hypothetical protein